MLSKSVIYNKFFWHSKEITEEEYNHVLSILKDRPIAPEGFTYYLTDSLEWKLRDLPPEAEICGTVTDTETM